MAKRHSPKLLFSTLLSEALIMFRILPRMKWPLPARLWYVPLLASAMGLMLLRLGVVARMLPVSEFATYSAGLLVSSSFGMLACFGLQSLLQRDLPVLIIRKRELAGEILLMQCVIIAIITGAAGIVLIAVTNGSVAGLTAAGLMISLFHGLTQQLFTIATIDSRSRNLTVRFAQQNLERAIPLVLVGPLVIFFGGGALTVLLIESILTIGLCFWLFFNKFSRSAAAIMIALRLGWKKIFNVQWRSAITLLAVSTLSFSVLNVDRWVAAQWLTKNDFGQYAFAWTIFSIAQSVQLIINSSVYPALAQKYALLGKATCYTYAMKFSLILLAVGVSVSAIFYPLSEFIISSIFQKYSESIIIIPVFLIVAVFRVSDFWSSYLIISGEETKILILLLLTSAIIVFSWFFSISFKMENVTLLSISMLALAVTVANYISLAFVAWRISR